MAAGKATPHARRLRGFHGNHCRLVSETEGGADERSGRCRVAKAAARRGVHTQRGGLV